MRAMRMAAASTLKAGLWGWDGDSMGLLGLGFDFGWKGLRCAKPTLGGCAWVFEPGAKFGRFA